MFRQLLAGAAVSACNIAMHALVMTAVVTSARTIASKDMPHHSMLFTCIMIVTVSILMAAHTLEVVIWALAYQMFDAAPAGSDLLYFAFVNFTTLGYGDVTPAKEWQLLGPMTAMNGVLLFGWSTAVIFEVLRRAMVRN
jgi:hypothetical protein